MAEAVLDLFPGTQLGIGPAIADGFYYDFKLDRAADARPTSPRSRSGWPRSVAADHPFVRRELPPEEGRAFFAEREPAVQGRDPRRPRREGEGRRQRRCRRRASTSTARSSTCARARTSRAPGRIGPFKLLAISRRVLARRREAAGAPADLRHGLADPGGARRLPVAARARRRSATTAGSASSSTCSASTTSRPGSAFWHPKGQMIWRTLEGAMRELQARRGYQEISTPILVHKKLWEQSGHWDHYDDNMFRVEVREPDLQPQADELPREHVHLPLAASLVSRPAAPLQRVRPAPPQRALGHAAAA